MRINIQDIGGGVLKRGQKFGGVFYPANKRFTGDELRQMVRPLNLRSMIDQHVIEVWPAHTPVPTLGEPGPEMALHCVSRGFGNFDVIQGRVLNEGPMTKEEAQAFIEARRGLTN